MKEKLQKGNCMAINVAIVITTLYNHTTSVDSVDIG